MLSFKIIVTIEVQLMCCTILYVTGVQYSDSQILKFILHLYSCTSLVAQTVKNPPAMQENWVQSLGWEDPLEEGMATHFSILDLRTHLDRGAWRATVHEVKKSWI